MYSKKKTQTTQFDNRPRYAYDNFYYNRGWHRNITNLSQTKLFLSSVSFLTSLFYLNVLFKHVFTSPRYWPFFITSNSCFKIVVFSLQVSKQQRNKWHCKRNICQFAKSSISVSKSFWWTRKLKTKIKNSKIRIIRKENRRRF